MSSFAQLTNKIKQLPQDKISQVVVVLLLIYIASILADITWRVMPSSEQASVNMPMQANNSSRNTVQGNQVDVRNLNALNIFGQYNAKKEEVVAEPVIDTTNAPETNLQLILSATVAEGNNSGRGTAIIESAGKQGTYGLEEKIGNTPAILKSVFADRVLIQNRAQLETLMLDGVEYDNMNVAREVKTPDSRLRDNNRKFQNPNERFPRDKNGQLLMPGQQKKAERKRNKSRQLQPAKKSNARKVDNRRDRKLSQELSNTRDQLQKDPSKISEMITFSPVKRKNELVGYRLNPGKNRELFMRSGLRPNDLAVQVNGYALNDIAQAMSALKDLRTMTEANIIVERDGVETEILFSLDGGASGQSSPPRSKISPMPTGSERK